MWKKGFPKRVALLGALLSAGAVVAGALTVVRGDLDVIPSSVKCQQAAGGQVDIGFAANLPDSQIQALLEKYDVTPRTAYVWVAGIGGSQRAFEPMDTEAFLQHVRSQSIAMKEKGLQSYPIRARRFVAEHSEDEVAESAALTTEARSLLNIHAQKTGALAAARNGAPLIHGVGVVGKKANIDRLRADPAVRFSTDCSMNAESKDPGRTGVLPDEYKSYWMDPTVAAMNAREVYRALQEQTQAPTGGR